MVGIHALSIAKFVSFALCPIDPRGFARPTASCETVSKPKGRPADPSRIAAPSQCRGPLPEFGSVHAHKDLLQVSPLTVCLSALDARTRWQIPGWRSRPTAKVAPLYRR